MEWVGDLHEFLGEALIALVAPHVAGVVFTSLCQRENLVVAMLTGEKRPPGPGDMA